MKLEHIKLSDLKLSPINVRKYGDRELGDLIASIRSIGVIQPLLVRPNCEGYEVVAGQRRLLACQALLKGGEAVSHVPCAILEAGDDAAAIEASLAENITRLPMDEIDQYEAFRALIEQGRGVGEIAHQFGVTETLVTRRLAIADLHAPILKAYRNEAIKPQDLRYLTLATKGQQKAWYKLLRAKDQVAPTGHRLKAWLFGGGEITTDKALFPLEQYDGKIISDLFGDEAYFDDATRFWKHQTEAIIDRQAAYLEDGWADVIIMNIGDWFPRHDKVRRSRKEGGYVYVSCASNGEVKYHEGWLPEKEAKRRDKQAVKEQGKGSSPSKPELSKAAQLYCELHRQNVVRLALLDEPQIALRVIAAHLVSGQTALWQIKPEQQKTGADERIAKSLKTSPATGAFKAARAKVRALLGFEDTKGPLQREGWKAASPDELLAKLMTLSDADVLTVLSFAMAETLEAGTPVVEALGLVLNVDMAANWEPDEPFFTLLKDKPAINGILAEVAGRRIAGSHVASTGVTQKKVIRDCLTGANGREKVAGWLPRYMKFPMQAYTKRKGLPHVDNARHIEKLFSKGA